VRRPESGCGPWARGSCPPPSSTWRVTAAGSRALSRKQMEPSGLGFDSSTLRHGSDADAGFPQRFATPSHLPVPGVRLSPLPPRPDRQDGKALACKASQREFDSRSGLHAPKVSTAARLPARQKERVRLPLGALYSWKPREGFQTFPRWCASGKARRSPRACACVRAARTQPSKLKMRVRLPPGTLPAKRRRRRAGFVNRRTGFESPRGLIEMETLRGFPILPAMVRAEQSSSLPRVMQGGWT
jgi:hypothetical protein